VGAVLPASRTDLVEGQGMQSLNVRLAVSKHLIQSQQRLTGTPGIRRLELSISKPGQTRTLNVVVSQLQARGARIVEVSIDHLEQISKAHAMTIISEMATAMEPYWQKHSGDFGPDTAINLSIGRTFTARDLLAAQKVRGAAMRQLKQIFTDVDVIVLPATACVAPQLRPDAVRFGESDLPVTAKLMRYSFLANFLGLPAGVTPMGLSQGLPMGFQAMADHWNEHLVLRVLNIVEEAQGPLPRPDRHWDILGKL